MAIFTVEIKDELVPGVAGELFIGPLKPGQDIEVIQSYLEEMVNKLYPSVVLKDPEVVAKKTEYDVLYAQKLEEANPTKPDKADSGSLAEEAGPVIP